METQKTQNRTRLGDKHYLTIRLCREIEIKMTYKDVMTDKQVKGTEIES